MQYCREESVWLNRHISYPELRALALLADLHGWPYQDVIGSSGRNKPENICWLSNMVSAVYRLLNPAEVVYV